MAEQTARIKQAADGDVTTKAEIVLERLSHIQDISMDAENKFRTFFREKGFKEKDLDSIIDGLERSVVPELESLRDTLKGAIEKMDRESEWSTIGGDNDNVRVMYRGKPRVSLWSSSAIVVYEKDISEIKKKWTIADVARHVHAVKRRDGARGTFILRSVTILRRPYPERIKQDKNDEIVVLRPIVERDLNR